MSNISTEVLDLNLGRAANNVPLALEFHVGKGEWKEVATGMTDSHGKSSLANQTEGLQIGRYRLTFNTQTYFAGLEMKAAYPYVSIVFEVTDTHKSIHVPLHLNRFGFSTSCT